jgi:hypothetical protein
VDVNEVDLLSREDVERENRYGTVASKFNSFQVEVQRGRIDGEADNVIEEREKGGRSPHVLLLGMLFKIQAFKSPSIDSPDKLFSLNVLDGLNQQELPLREAIGDDFVFCQAVREACGVRIAHELALTSASVRYRMKKGGRITGFAQVTKPYCLRDGAAKALNESRKCSTMRLFQALY